MARTRPFLRAAVLLAVAVTLVAEGVHAPVPVTGDTDWPESIGVQAPTPTVAIAPVERGVPQLLPVAQVSGVTTTDALGRDSGNNGPGHSGPPRASTGTRRRLLCTYLL